MITVMENWNEKKGSINLRHRLKNTALAVHLTSHATERMLILFAALCGTWFLMFDVYPPNDSFGTLAVKSLFWAGLFASSVAIHLTALAFNSLRFRIGACLYHSIIWGMWTGIAFTSLRPTMATPLLFGLSIMAFYEAVRLKPDNA